jgi:undecaprenyl-diphosphatase
MIRAMLQIAVLAVIQGLAELLPVSSSAHVIVAERMMGLDPSSPEMTFLLVMLHTGTMFAVILYFRNRWRPGALLRPVFIATAATGVLGLALKHVIETVFLRHHAKAEIEHLFSNMPLVAAALASAGVLILAAGRAKEGTKPLADGDALWIGLVQGVCLPFRGFSRSGATISTALLRGIPRAAAEDFSFALAVVLTPPVILREAHRLHKAAAGRDLTSLFAPGLGGMVLSFLAGLAALRWLSAWLERGRWSWFGYYCLAAAAAIFAMFR